MWTLSKLAKEEDKLKFELTIEMGLAWAAMMRVFEEGAKKKLQHQVVLDLAEKVFNAGSKGEFTKIHSDFCEWGISNIDQASRANKPPKCRASWGQIAKTLDVTLKVAVYYCHLPNYEQSERICRWLNAAVDTAMMRSLEKFRKAFSYDLPSLPITIKEVTKPAYENIQYLVRESIRREHNNAITCPQWEDIHWAKANEYERVM